MSPDSSVVIPVNAQGDLDNVLNILGDLGRYNGSYRIEIVLVVNNYPPDAPPVDALERFETLSLRVVAIPDVRRPGEAVGFTARIPGVKTATAEYVLLFDADCRIPDAAALLDWYTRELKAGAALAYAHVDYYDYPPLLSVRARIAAHHGARWFKRVVLGIPTNRGSSYAVNRTMLLEHYGQGRLADEMNVGPVFKHFGGKIVYSGARELVVLTSGRMFVGGWRRLAKTLNRRLRYNLRVLPVRKFVAEQTQRENDPVRRYINNRPLR
jgi:hypothetical protein